MASTTPTGRGVQEGIGAAADKAQEAVGRGAEALQDAIGRGSERAQDVAGRVADRAHETAGRVGDRMRDVAHTAGQKADDLTHRAGNAIESLGETVRERSPHEGTLGKVADRLAENLESGGHYLQEEGLTGMAEDLTDVVRRNPIPSLLIAVGLGYLIARATSNRS